MNRLLGKTLSSNYCFSLYRLLSSYPKHMVVGMPALSPTMTSGTISVWKKNIGDKCIPGDTIAEIETDKASMAFEGQDEFYIAKLLVAAGGEVTVGSPILITVEDESLVAAFANYKVDASAAAVAPTPAAPVAVAATPAVAVPVPVVSKPAPVSIPAPVVAPAASTHASPVVPALGMYSVRLPGSVNKSSPLTGKIQADQKAYSVKYGRTVVQVESKKGK